MSYEPTILPKLATPALDNAIAPLATRNVWQAMLRGMAQSCPACGRGKMFSGYLKVNHACAACGEELHHQRADDAPPYLTIFIVGHIVLGLLVTFDMLDIARPIWLDALIWPALTLVLALWILPIAKGAMIGLQWANRMHGFGGEDEGVGKI